MLRVLVIGLARSDLIVDLLCVCVSVHETTTLSLKFGGKGLSLEAG